MGTYRELLTVACLTVLLTGCGAKESPAPSAETAAPAPAPAESTMASDTAPVTVAPPAPTGTASAAVTASALATASEAISDLPTTTSGPNPWAPPTTTTPAPAVPQIEPVKTGPAGGSASKGAALFASKCVSCHGKEARGDTAMGKKYGILDFRSADVRALTTKDLEQIMKLGKGKLSEGAHPKANMSEQDIRDMVAFIQSLK